MDNRKFVLSVEQAHFDQERNALMNYIFERFEEGYALKGIENNEVSDDRELVIPAQHLDLPIIAIMTNAFYGCTYPREITFSSEIMYVLASAFENCVSLESIKIPFCEDGVIDQKAFKGCTKLKNVDLQEGLSFILEGAFMNCTNLESITIPYSVKRIKNEAFRDCNSLKEVVFLGDPKIDVDAFSNHKSMVFIARGEHKHISEFITRDEEERKIKIVETIR